MSYIKVTQQPMLRLLKAYDLGTGEALARVLEISPNTARRKLNNIELLSVADLRMINKRGHVPIEEIRQCV